MTTCQYELLVKISLSRSGGHIPKKKTSAMALLRGHLQANFPFFFSRGLDIFLCSGSRGAVGGMTCVLMWSGLVGVDRFGRRRFWCLCVDVYMQVYMGLDRCAGIGV